MKDREARLLVSARVAFGLLFLLRTAPLLGWPAGEWTIPVTGLSLPSALVAALCVVRTIAAFMFTCGVRARTAGIVAAASGYLVLAQDRFAFINSLHVLFLGTFVLALTAAPLVRPSSSVRLLGLFLASIYLWAGLAKMQPEWLSGHALESQARAGAFAGPLGAWVEHAWFRGAVSIAIPLIELAVAGLLVADRRRPAIALALLFHLAVELTVKPDTLGLQMAVLLFAIWPVATGRVASR